MDKLPRWSGKKIINIFEKDGWTVDRIEGSHYILVKEGTENILVIPVHGKKPIKIGLLKGLIKDAGLINEEFLILCYNKKRR
ncbi:MAG: addiction module toxin, HicA family [Methanosarcinales archaeon]|uniref:Addiction module toxin, HicA family n=1 Tax=Candidatus Ethanoperedens thermophilum TaxID=2766897 RepID=A0A848D9P7_9EURY|nr:addiction module toxin, HicA family [Candidatus Ethanoperedens thermophilum]